MVNKIIKDIDIFVSKLFLDIYICWFCAILSQFYTTLDNHFFKFIKTNNEPSRQKRCPYQTKLCFMKVN